MKRLARVMTGKVSSCLLIAVVSLAPLSRAHGTDLLINGGFESGNSGFTSGYVYQDSLYPPGTYCVGSNPHDHHEQFFDMAAQEGLLMMIANGADQPGVILWSESGIPVAPQTTYHFSIWAASVSDRSPARLSFSINGSLLGVMEPTLDGAWHEFSALWDSGSDSWADVVIVDLNTDFGGNDFAIDNVFLDEQPPTPTVGTTWGWIKQIYR